MTAASKLAGQPIDTARNSWFVLAMFWIALLFQDTGLKFIWGLETEARIVNLVSLSLMSVYATHALMFRKFDRKVWYFYLLPGLLVFAGMLLNITWNTMLDMSILSYYGLVLPWAAYLMIPALLKTGRIDGEMLWRLFYYFMVAAVALGLSDYVFVLTGTSNLHPISTPNGIFLAGRFSLLHMLQDGTAHTRFYGWFIEPGTLAMFLLPALAYAALHKRYVGIVIMLVGLYFTQSLGGIIGLMMLVVVLAFVIFNKRRFIIPAALFSVAVAAVLWVNVGDYLVKEYEERGNSRTIREDNLKNTVTYLPAMIMNNPLGFRLAKDLSAKDREFDFGTNFTVGNALQFGGLSAFLGYVVCLLVSFACSVLVLFAARNLSVHEKVVFGSIIVLLPFVVQRTVVWDTAMFAFLFAPSVIDVLRGRRGSAIQTNRRERQIR